MTVPFDRMLTVPELRAILGLPRSRPDGVREVLAVPRPPGAPVPPRDSWRLALGDWPEAWAAEPGTGPRYLVMLRGTVSPYFIATVEDIDASAWGLDGAGTGGSRVVPVRGTAHSVTALTAGCQLETDIRFGWQQPEEQFAFW